jgi:hypothetical protein
MALPPSVLGGLKVIDAEVLLPVAVPIVGAPGTLAANAAGLPIAA